MNKEPQLLSRATAYLQESMRVKQSAFETAIPSVVRAAQLLGDSLKKGRKILLCGNGGSASDCQHIATEFVCRLSKDFERPAIPAIALTTDTSFLTAYPNDYNFDGIFSRQVEALGNADDVLIGLSTSGGSRNVIKAFETAKEKKLHTIAFIGEGGPISSIASVTISVPCRSTGHIQESHMCLYHVLCDLTEQILYGEFRG
jgi:D-sedoheptulose 7-phosphate isomerase